MKISGSSQKFRIESQTERKKNRWFMQLSKVRKGEVACPKIMEENPWLNVHTADKNIA
jgi:hypothetical protein